jgi:hypothetical protein
MTSRTDAHRWLFQVRLRTLRVAFVTLLFVSSQPHIGWSKEAVQTPPRLRLVPDEITGFCNWIFKPSFPWVDSALLQEKALRVKYRVTPLPKDRPGFPIYFVVYSQRLHRGVLLDVNWDGTRCGEFRILNNAGVKITGDRWEIDQHSPPLGGIATQGNLQRQLRKLSETHESLEIDPRNGEKGCGTWASYVGETK